MVIFYHLVSIGEVVNFYTQFPARDILSSGCDVSVDLFAFLEGKSGVAEVADESAQ